MKKTFIVIMVAVLMLALAACVSEPSLADDDTENENLLTLEKYQEIQNGMTYEEVVEIIGFEGTMEAELGEPGTDLHTFSIRYMGEDQIQGSLGANASFMFQGGKLNMKVQLGLE